MLYPCCVPDTVYRIVQKFAGQETSSLFLWKKLHEALGSSCEITQRAAQIFIRENFEDLKELKAALDIIDFGVINGNKEGISYTDERPLTGEETAGRN